MVVKKLTKNNGGLPNINQSELRRRKSKIATMISSNAAMPTTILFLRITLNARKRHRVIAYPTMSENNTPEKYANGKILILYAGRYVQKTKEKSHAESLLVYVCPIDNEIHHLRNIHCERVLKISMRDNSCFEVFL